MDIISSLPDPILSHILSFLPICYSAKTSVLARRWRYLWTYVHILRFCALYDDNPKSKKRMCFSDMVDRVLLLHNGSLDELMIDTNGNNATETQIESWISTAMAHKVQVFLLSEVWFPQFRYKCETLVEMTLERSKISIDSDAIRLPRLKKLDLCDMSYDNDDTLPNLISGCSAIEDLVLRRARTCCDEMVCCYVCSPTLKSLVMEFGVECDDDHKHKLVLDLPALQNLRIQDDTSQIIQAKNLSSIVQANICFLDGYVLKDIRRPMYIFQFIDMLSNAKSLTFSCVDSTGLLDPAFSFATGRFHNLINLGIQANWHVLTELLACAYNCKNLVELTLKQCSISIEPGGVCLLSLRKLRLLSNTYKNDRSLPNLVSGCSAVEDLVLERHLRGICDDMTCCYVCSPTLKSLVLDFELSCGYDHKHKLVLDVPAVQNLRIQDDTSLIIQAKNLSSIVQANICFLDGKMVEDIRQPTYIFQFIEKLSNAKSLTVSSEDTTLLLNPTLSFATRRFHNLINLDLQAHWHILTELLACAYKLESLTIQEVYDELKCWRRPKELPECLLSSLQSVTIYGFVGRQPEFNMVGYILRHAEVLKTMNIYLAASHHDCHKLDILERISYITRGFRRCRLTFV